MALALHDLLLLKLGRIQSKDRRPFKAWAEAVGRDLLLRSRTKRTASGGELEVVVPVTDPELLFALVFAEAFAPAFTPALESGLVHVLPRK